MTEQSDAALAADIVREAGRLALRMRAEGLSAQQKTSVSDVVTAADHAAEELVVRRLREQRPDDAILGEEGATHEGTSGRRWVIDPVDGTYNFVQGSSWWCSALALEVGGAPVLGAVHHPAEDTLYVGGEGRPATRDGVRLEPLADRPLATSCLTTYLHPTSYAGEVGATFGRMVGGAATLRMQGSGTMDAMAIARGIAHVQCQHSVPPWDALPGAAIIRSLGGVTERVRAGGVEWYVAGVPTAAAEVVAALLDR